MTHSKKFVVGRYYFNSLFRDQANSTFIKDLMKEPFISEKTFDYAIGNIETDQAGRHIIIRGTFGRMRKGTIAKTYDKKKKEFKQEEIPEIADTMLEFFINHENHLIFIEHGATINPEYFAGKFKKIYANTKPIADLEIDYIFIEKDVYQTIKQWNTVDKVVFRKLRPSNPSSLDDFEEIEGLLKETRSKSTDINFEAPNRGAESSDEGLNYNSKLIKQGIALSSHGYGVAQIKGTEDGKEVEVESRKFLKKVEVDFTADGALDKITQTIEEISNTEEND